MNAKSRKVEKSKSRKSRAPSPAIALLRNVWEHHGYGMGHSWERLNAAMSTALSLAIWSGMRFDLDDFKTIAKEFNFGYWGGNDRHMSGEMFYLTACNCETRYASGRRYPPNPSCCLAFESWKDRRPFIVRSPDKKTGARVAVGARFEWRGEQVECTSFAEDGSRLVACTYKEPKRDENGYAIGPRKVLERTSITHDAIREYHADQKTLHELRVQWKRFDHKTTESLCDWVKRELGVGTDRQLGSLKHDQLERLSAEVDRLAAAAPEPRAEAG